LILSSEIIHFCARTAVSLKQGDKSLCIPEGRTKIDDSPRSNLGALVLIKKLAQIRVVPVPEK